MKLYFADPVRGQQTGGYRIFISTPRVRQGIPVTLSTVTSTRSGNSFLLAAFPNLQSQAPIPNQQNQQNQQQSQNCDGLVTVDKMHVSWNQVLILRVRMYVYIWAQRTILARKCSRIPNQVLQLQQNTNIRYHFSRITFLL